MDLPDLSAALGSELRLRGGLVFGYLRDISPGPTGDLTIAIGLPDKPDEVGRHLHLDAELTRTVVISAASTESVLERLSTVLDDQLFATAPNHHAALGLPGLPIKGGPVPKPPGIKGTADEEGTGTVASAGA